MRTNNETAPTDNPIETRIRTELADLSKRRLNVLTQMEEYEPTGDKEIDRDCRAELRHRQADLASQYKLKTEQLTALAAPAPEPHDDPTLLDELPVVTGTDLTAVPEKLLRDLYESFDLEVRYQPHDHAVILRVTLRQDRLPGIQAALDLAIGSAEPEAPDGQSEQFRRTPAERTDVLGTPNGI